MGCKTDFVLSQIWTIFLHPILIKVSFQLLHKITLPSSFPSAKPYFQQPTLTRRTSEYSLEPPPLVISVLSLAPTTSLFFSSSSSPSSSSPPPTFSQSSKCLTMRYDSKYFYNFERDKESDHEYRVDTDCKKMATDLSQRTALKTVWGTPQEQY